MQEIIDKIYDRMEFCANEHTNCQAEEQAYIAYLSCLNEILDQIETFPWDHLETTEAN